jgi:hypothetical protein
MNARGLQVIAMCAVVAGSPVPGVAGSLPTRLTFEVSPGRGELGDTYVATVHVEVPGVSGPERYSHPAFPGFKVVDTKMSSTTSMAFDPDGGQHLRTVQVRQYVLQPREPGRFVLGPVRIRLRGETFESRQVGVWVGSDSGETPPAAPDVSAAGAMDVPGFVPPEIPAGVDMHLHAVADKREVFVGEQVTVSWLLYSRSEVLSIEPNAPPLEDFWWEKIYEPQKRLRYHDARVGNVPYLASVIAQRAVFPTRTGELFIPPFRARVSNMSSLQGHPRVLASPRIRVRARPLPAGAPSGFDPTYVGVYSVDAALDRKRLTGNEAFSLTVTVRGDGAVRRLSTPVIEVPGIAVGPASEEEPHMDTATGVVRGERVFVYSGMPERVGQIQIPPVVVPYFDPATQRYHSARSAPLSIEVLSDPAQRDDSQSDTGLRENVIGRDIRPLHGGQVVASRTVALLYQSRWFWIWALAPIVGFVAVVAGDRLRERLRKETPRSRLRKARGRARGRLRVAEMHLRGNRPAKFYGELTRVLYEHIEDRVGKSVQPMTINQLEEFLLEKGFPEPAVRRIGRELEAADFARFVPSASGPGEMKAAHRRVKDLLREIEKVRPEEPS